MGSNCLKCGSEILTSGGCMNWQCRSNIRIQPAPVATIGSSTVTYVDYSLYETSLKQIEKLRAENERLGERYRLIELANKEWTRNDAVTFGKLLEENSMMREALEFYAAYKSWSAFGYTDEFESIIKDGSVCKDRDRDIIGGRRARECLAKLSKKEVGE